MINRDNGTADKINSLNPKPSKRLRHTLLAVAIAQAVIVPCVQAASIVVNSPGDGGLACSLRDAVQAINQGSLGTTGCTNTGGPFSGIGSISFQSNVNLVTLSATALDINHSMQISAANGVSIRGDAVFSDRLVNIDGPYAVGLIGLSFNGGTVTGLTKGSVIYVKTGSVAINNGVIRNGVGGTGGGLFLDGATGLLINTTVTGNSSILNGGVLRFVTTVL